LHNDYYENGYMSDPSPKRILYIDSDPTDSALFRTVMEQEGYRVDLAATVEDGVAMFQADPQPLVIASHHPDDKTMLDALGEFESHDSDPVLILITDKGDDDTIVKALKLGVQRCVPRIDETIYTDVLPAIIVRPLHRRENGRRALTIEAELRRNEDRFLHAEALSNSCNWESDETLTHWAYASIHTEHMLGVPLKDLLGNYELYIRHIHPDDQDRVRAVYTAAAETHAPYEVRYRFCRPDGHIIHLREHAVPVLDDSGKIMFYRGTTQDVTSQVDAEERHRIVVENAVEAIITIDSGGIIQSFNKAAETLLHYSRTEAIGQNISMMLPDDHAVQHDAYLARYLDTRKAHIIGIGRDVDARRKDGSTFPAHLSVSQHDVGGTILFTGLLRDISEQKESEVMLIQAKNESERANRAKSEFLSSMSHELRTPLNAVLGFAQMLEYNPAEPLSVTQQESVDLIKRGGAHLLTLINEILELAKIESGRLDLSIETVDLAKTIDDCASIAKATAMNRDIVLANASADKKLPYVQADNTRLKQVLLNLLSNAVKYNKDAGHVTIDANETQDGFMRVSVSDTGIGLSEREKKKIFEPFERLGKQSEAIEGTGIGLTITKQLVNLMSGRIGFESEIGKGSTFWIDIPKSDKGSKKKLKRRRSDLEAISTGPIADPERTYSVLCVEDNEDNAKLMVRIFDSISNADLHVAVTGRAGVQYAKKFQPDMILMDINLPDISGIEATKILQRTDATKDIPIIAISASIWRAKNGVTEDVSFHHYVEKPFDVNEIYNLINSVLSGEPK